jgi:hypothetical protein
MRGKKSGAAPLHAYLPLLRYTPHMPTTHPTILAIATLTFLPLAGCQDNSAPNSAPKCVSHQPEGVDWAVTSHGLSTTLFIEGGGGWEGNFVLVEVTVENRSDSESTIYWGHRLVDGDGYLYQYETGPCLQLDVAYGGDSACMAAPTLNPWQSERGVLVYDVNELTSAPFSLRVYDSPAVFDESDFSCASVLPVL